MLLARWLIKAVEEGRGLFRRRRSGVAERGGAKRAAGIKDRLRAAKQIDWVKQREQKKDN